MKPQFADLLRCPACGRERTLRLHEDRADEREVREGSLRCSACATVFEVHRGVPELLFEPAEHILLEAAGLERFAEHMRATGWTAETVRSLPNVEHGYWYVQARSMHQLLTTVPLRQGQSVLDVGSNTCWATNHFAERGMCAIALDIATVELQGLYTSDWFLESGEVFFERILGSMDAIPLASSSVDYVYCCEVLHHNDAESLRRTFSEIFRVLKPGGRLLMVNETLKTARDPSGVDTEGVEQFEGYEHAHWALQYRAEAVRAGFHTTVIEPHYRSFFGDAEPAVAADLPSWRARLQRAAFGLRRVPLARRCYLAWLNHVWGGVSMNMVATKPVRFLGRGEGVGVAERLLRTLAASAWLRRDRRRGLAPGKVLRTPEQADAAWQARVLRDSQQQAARTG